ncbi:MAG: septum formation protein Maf, partial [Candidatus Hydrogenedentes bacterium]|nr:septum formation protein Maf [Candidatus Hydrogenedentota bacterium]
EANARAKRDEVAARLSRPAIVIAADTLVFLDEHVLSKPRDHDEACAMLRRLSDNTHQVVTGLALIDTETGAAIEGSESTDVTFRRLTDREIARFVEVVKPLDRAGAYTVDGPGSLLVARYDGCYQNVLGLPIVKLDKLLRELGVSLFEQVDPARAKFL